MKNTFKRIAVIALAVIMCVSAAVPAFAAGNACPGPDKTHTAFNCTYVEANKQEATCNAAGFVTGKCTSCNAIFSVSQTEALGHVWETPDVVCETEVVPTCKICGETDKENKTTRHHLYTAWTLKEGECGVANARVTRTCVYCDDEEPGNTSDEGHIFALVSYIEPAKCVGVGVATYECVVAGCDAVKEVPVYATANVEGEYTHNYVAWDSDADDAKALINGKKDPNAKKATCTEKGRKSMICLDCENVVVVATDKADHDPAKTDSKNAKFEDGAWIGTDCTKAGNIDYWRCLDCKKYFANAACTEEIEKADTVVPSIHDGLKTSKDAIDYEYLPTCDTDGLVIYSCKVEGCDEEGEYTLPKYASHVYYNDVKDVATKKTIITALQDVAKLAAEATEETSDDNYYLKGESISDWSDAKVESEWAKLGEVKVGGSGEGKVWSGYTPADCEKNATVTYLCLNFTYSYETEEYVFATCNVATETVLTGAGYDKVAHKFADYYPASHSTKPGQQAYAWAIDDKGTETTEDDVVLAASCKTIGRKINYCINEHMDADGDYVECGKTETVGVAALGHDYVAYDEANIKDDADYTLKTGTVKGSDLKNTVKADKVTCVKDGKAYTVCTRCNDVQVKNVSSTGAEHVWVEVDAFNNPNTKTPDCVTPVTGVYRKCDIETCKAYNILEPVTLPATGHKYADITDKDVLAALLALEVNTPDADGNVLRTKGTCESGAVIVLNCLNPNCAFPKSVEIKEGFATGHVKTYIPNSAIAAYCDEDGQYAGSSNKWYCANKGCDHYGYIKNNGEKVMPSVYGVDTVTGTPHQIWNAKTEAYEQVTYKNVPDANVSGAENEDKAALVEAPVVDGKVVRCVAIEGTSYVWVYKYESEDHRVASVEEGFLFCVDCGDYDVFDADDHDYKAVTKPATCTEAGYTVYTCKDCFDTYVEDITNKDSDGKVVTHNYKVLTTVEATCDRAGYVIKECVALNSEDKAHGCGKIVTESIKALGHTVNGAELTSSCLNTLTTRKCTRCFTTIAKAHKFNENGMCTECGAAK